MQERHQNRKQYFCELAKTSKDFYLDYLRPYITLTPQTRVLEIGCGEGGNLLPFAEMGCEVKGVDICDGRIEQARAFFAEFGQKGTFVCENFIEAEKPQDEADKFDLVLVHDVIEHIEPPYKETFVGNIRPLLKRGGLVFFGFPAWQMPFGGHQQIGRGFASKTPFIHILPVPMYRALLKVSGENEGCIKELLSIKRAQMSIEGFERVCRETGFSIVNRKFWFINPHYKQKFNMTPMALNSLLGKIPYFRNYYTTSAFYLLKVDADTE